MTEIKFTKATVQIRSMKGITDKAEGYHFNHEGIDLVVHKNVAGGSGWSVTEQSTGLGVFTIAVPTRKMAVENALNLINKKGAAELKAGLDKNKDKVIKEAKEKHAEEEKAEREAKVDQRKAGEIAAAEYYAKHKDKDSTLKVLEFEYDRMKNFGTNSEQTKEWINGYVKVMRGFIEDERAKQVEPEPEQEAPEQEEPEQEAPEQEEPIKEEPKKKWNIGSFFRGVETADALKSAYKKFAKWLHPDVSDYENADEAFKAMQTQYEKALELIKQGRKVDEKIDAKLDQLLAEAISKISHLEGIEIKVRGSWVWVAGLTFKDTEKHEVLKAAGFKFGKKAKEWYFAAETAGTPKRRGQGYTPDQMKEKFGETVVKGSKTEKLKQA